MIILLTGPTGSGKTDTSWALLEITKDMVFLDCDWFASMLPFSWEKESDVVLVYQALNTMIDFYTKKSYTNFVITLTTQMAILFKKYQDYFCFTGNTIYSFRLKCNESELLERISKRDRNAQQKQQELIDCLNQQSIFDRTFIDDSVFKSINVTNLTELEVASKILKEISKS